MLRHSGSSACEIFLGIDGDGIVLASILSRGIDARQTIPARASYVLPRVHELINSRKTPRRREDTCVLRELGRC